LWAQDLNANVIHKEMVPVYDGKCLSRKAVHKWVEKFSRHSEVSGDARPGAEVAETRVKNLCAAGFDALVKRWNKCLNVDGRYVEK
jgi:hypothetical protein